MAKNKTSQVEVGYMTEPRNTCVGEREEDSVNSLKGEEN